MLPKRSKDDDDFQRTSGRVAEGLCPSGEPALDKGPCSDGVKKFAGFDGVECGFERQALMDAEPLAGMAVPLDVEPVAADPVDTGEGRIELFAKVFGEARSVALQEAIFSSVPFPLNVDWVIEGGRGDDRQELRLQDGVDKRLACRRDGSLFVD